MKCDTKTMWKAAAGIGAVLMGAYLVFPEAKALILVSSPFLLILLCPLSMMFMMKAMQGGQKDSDATKRDDLEPTPPVVSAATDAARPATEAGINSPPLAQSQPADGR